MNKMKLFEDATLELVLFGSDVIVTSETPLDKAGNDNETPANLEDFL